jgi:hypothetical protein
MALQDRALVVGINCYPAIGPLHGAEADARDFYSWVTDPAGGGVAPANATLILGRLGPSGKARDAEPTRAQIEDFFRDIDDAANQNSADGLGLTAGKRLYMFFSGHGFAPSFDRSAVLVANTTPTALDNLACRLWADRLFEGGWFQELLLFQDACRNRLGAGTLMPPFLGRRNAPGSARFYALAGQDGKLALEKPDSTGQNRGVFTLTLMEGLRVHARDPISKAITDASLKAYLQSNMKAKYTEAEQENEENAQIPDVFNPDPFVILPAPPGAVAATLFPVRISLAGLKAQITNGTFTVIAQNEGTQVWQLDLPIGFYKVAVDGGGQRLFEVTGALKADGEKDTVNVTI